MRLAMCGVALAGVLGACQGPTGTSSVVEALRMGPAALIGTVEGETARAHVQVLTRTGVLTGAWSTETPKTFRFEGLPDGSRVVVVAWAPNAISPAAQSLLPALGTPDYAQQFDWWFARKGHRLWAGHTTTVALTMEPGPGLTFEVQLAGLVPGRAVPQARVQVMQVDDADQEIHTVEDITVEGEDGARANHPLARGEPHRMHCPCTCGVRFRIRTHVPGYRPYERFVPMPIGPAVTRFTIPLADLGHGTHGRVVDAATGAPIPGALLGSGTGSEHGNRGLGDMEDDEALPTPDDWLDWLGATPVDADGRFELRPEHYESPLVAVVPGRGCSDRLDLDHHTGPVELRVQAGPTITGVVHDAETGAPLADVLVVLVHHAPEDSGMGIPAPDAAPDTALGTGVGTRTDAAGRYAFVGVPLGWVVEPRALVPARAGSARRRTGVAYHPPRLEDPMPLDPDGERDARVDWLERRVAADELVRFQAHGEHRTYDLPVQRP